MPLKRSDQLALGTCTTNYAYDKAELDKERRHYITVDWSEEHTSRSVLKDDLVNTLNSSLTVFSPTRNQAEQRLRTLQRTGADPWAHPFVTNVPPSEAG